MVSAEEKALLLELGDAAIDKVATLEADFASLITAIQSNTLTDSQQAYLVELVEDDRDTEISTTIHLAARGHL